MKYKNPIGLHGKENIRKWTEEEPYRQFFNTQETSVCSLKKKEKR